MVLFGSSLDPVLSSFARANVLSMFEFDTDGFQQGFWSTDSMD
jgi:hypothetical protein